MDFNRSLGSRSLVRPFLVCGRRVGWILPSVLHQMALHPDVFVIHRHHRADNAASNEDDVEYVELHPALTTYDDRTCAVATVMNEWRTKDLFPCFKSWRNEELNIWHRFSEEPVFKMERGVVSLFGAKKYGAHINGYLMHPERGLCMWIARRSMTKPTWPGKLDQMAAGALASTDDILGCARREAQEEASVPDDILDQLRPSGTVSYFYEDERGLFPEILFIFDVEVPLNFEPVNRDGEVESFTLMDIPQIKAAMITEDFKFNCALVVLDFFIRHGIIKPDEEPNYTYLAEQLHQNIT